MQNQSRTAVRKQSLLGAAFILGFAATAASGQENGPSSPVKPGATGPTVETITVTARRRSENEQTVPISVTAFTEKDLASKNIQNSRDLATAVPGLNVNSTFSTTQLSFTIRGQVPDPFSNTVTVQTYYNDVAPIYASSADMYDMDSAQVLRGPQGTLFGRSSLGGAILFAPKLPDWEFGGYVEAQGGNLDDHELRAAVTIPLIDDVLSVRVAGDIVRRDGYTTIENENGYDLDNKDFQSIRLSVRYHPISWLENITTYTYHDVDQHSGSYEIIDAPPGGLASLVANPFDPAYATFLAQNPDLAAIPGVAGGLQTYLKTQSEMGPREINTNVPSSILIYTEKVNFLTNTTTANVGDLTIKNIFGFQTYYSAQPFNADGAPIPLFNAASLEGQATDFFADQHQISEELQALGSLGNGALDYVVGGYYQYNADMKPGDVIQHAALAFLTYQATVVQTQQRTTDEAIYTQEIWHITDALSLTGGARYTSDIVTANSWSLAGPTNSRGVVDGPTYCYGYPTIPATYQTPQCEGPSSRVNSAGLNWLGSLDYKWSDNTLLYVTSRRGVQPGGVNSTSTIPQSLTFGGAKTTDFEAGLKTDQDVDGVAVRFNFDGYYDSITNAQRTVAEQDPRDGQAEVLTVNAESATVKGIEAELTAAFSDSFQLSGWADYTDAQYNEFNIPNFILDPSDPRCANPATLMTCNLVIGSYTSAAGNPFEYTPQFQVGANATLVIPIPAEIGQLTLNVTYFHQDPFALTATIQDNPHAVAQAEDLVGARLDWTNAFGRPIDISIWGKNLTNETYLVGGTDIDQELGFSIGTYGEPRTYGITVRYKLGEDAAN